MYDEVAAHILRHQHIAILAHFRPDGDAIGSTLALGLALEELGKTVKMYNEDTLPPSLSFLEHSDRIQQLPDALPDGIDLIICVDCGAWKRLGDHAIRLLDREQCSIPIINIDHHGSNERYGYLNLVEAHQAATGCMIDILLGHLGLTTFSPAIATALYTAINTDTGSFQYGSTSAEVMRTAAKLIDFGVDVQDVNRHLYQEVPYSTLMVNREVLNHMVVEMDGQISHYSIDVATKQRMNLSLDDTKDLVEIIRVIQGVKASVIVEELECGRIRMSLRSKDPKLNVAKVAEIYGGGGHHMAAGIRMSGDLAQCREQVLASLREAVTEASSC